MQFSTLIAGAITCAVASMSATPVQNCTSTITVHPTIVNRYTDTVYEVTFTETDSLDCGGCNTLAVYDGPGGQGGARHVTATVTEDFTVTTELACSSTATE